MYGIPLVTLIGLKVGAWSKTAQENYRKHLYSKGRREVVFLPFGCAQWSKMLLTATLKSSMDKTLGRIGRKSEPIEVQGSRIGAHPSSALPAIRDNTFSHYLYQFEQDFLLLVAIMPVLSSTILSYSLRRCLLQQWDSQFNPVDRVM